MGSWSAQVQPQHRPAGGAGGGRGLAHRHQHRRRYGDEGPLDRAQRLTA
ncbi:MAG: hypothetical protein GY856_23970 [bacterium]|nr:hypothetical protein [bacterium]